MPRTGVTAPKEKQGAAAYAAHRATPLAKRTRSRRTASIHVPSRSTRNGRRVAPTDAIALLRADHRKVRRLLEALAATHAPARRERLRRQIENELKEHKRIEEDIFYPAYHKAVRSKQDRQLFYEATEEHHAIDLVLADLAHADVGSETFAARAKVLRELVEHHADEEERQMFPRTRKAMSPDTLKHLGAEIAACKEEHSRPTGLQVVGALLTKPFTTVIGAQSS